MNPTALDGIRIESVQHDGGGLRIAADVAAAYPPAAGLQRFRRVFSFAPPGSFTVEDDVVMTEAKPIQWYLHADAAI